MACPNWSALSVQATSRPGLFLLAYMLFLRPERAVDLALIVASNDKTSNLLHFRSCWLTFRPQSVGLIFRLHIVIIPASNPFTDQFDVD